LLWPQTATTENSKPERVIRIIRVHGDADQIAALAGTGIGGVTVIGSNKLGAVVIKGTQSDVESLARTVAELDSASATANAKNTLGSKNIELVVYVVAGSVNPLDSSTDPGAELLAPVYKQLRTVFPYTHYQLLNTVLMRSGQNSLTRTNGMMRKLPSSLGLYAPGTYGIIYDAVTASTDTPPTIHIEKFNFEARIPVPTGPPISSNTTPIPGYQQVSITIQTDVDLQEGQKVVIGTSNIESSEATLFLVVSARIVR
jgi:hypothetical protein